MKVFWLVVYSLLLYASAAQYGFDIGSKYNMCIIKTLKLPTNQLEINKQNVGAFRAMENDPLPEYK